MKNMTYKLLSSKYHTHSFLIFLMVRKVASNFRIDINSEQIKTFEVSVTPFAQIKGIK